MTGNNGSETYTRRRLAQAAALGALAPGAGIAAKADQASGSQTSNAANTIFDARQFGAKGDGKSDDTKAIQSAIDAGTRGGAVFVPPGVYLSSELRLRPHVSLIGVAGWSYRSPGGSVIRLADPKAACLLNITGAFGVSIDGLSLEGGGLGTNTHGILLNKPDYGKEEDTFRIERSQIAHFSGDGVRLVRAWCFSIRHCMIAHSGGDGVSLRGWDGFLMDNWLSGNRGAGFGAREENASCTFTGNRIEWNGEGILIAGGDGYNITGNFFDRSGGCALVLRKGANGPCEQVNITGNFFKRSGKTAKPDSYDSGQVKLEGARGVTFTGNNLQVGRDDGGGGQLSPSYGIIYRDLQHCVISNNVLHNGALKELLADLGGNETGVVVKDNPGCLFQAKG
jgi:hypothetical protein